MNTDNYIRDPIYKNRRLFYASFRSHKKVIDSGFANKKINKYT